MTEGEIAKCRNRLQQFLADLLDPPGRRERRQLGFGVRPRPVAGRGTQIDRTDGEAPGGGELTGDAAVDRAEPLGLGAGLGTLGAAHDGGNGPRAGVGDRRHRFSQTSPSLGGSGAPVFGHAGQDRELPSGGELASSGTRRKYDSGLATVLAPKLDGRRRTPGPSGHPGDGAIPDQVATGFGIDRRGAGLGLASPSRAGRRRLRRGYGVSRGAGSSQAPLCGGCLFLLGSVDRSPSVAQTETSRSRASSYGLSLWRAATLLGSRGGGHGGRLEAGALARRHERLARVALLRRPGPALARI